MSVNTVLKGKVRETLGTGSARELRRQGMIPATIYGNDNKPMSVAVEEKEVTKLYRKHGFTSTVLEIDIDGKKFKVIPKTVDLHPVKEMVRHADFMFLAAKGTQKVAVPVVYEGKEKSVGIKRGGFFNIIKRKLMLNVPVTNVPQDIKVNISEMEVGESVWSRDITLPEGCSFAFKNEVVLASMTGRSKKADKEDEASAEGAEAESEEAKE